MEDFDAAVADMSRNSNKVVSVSASQTLGSFDLFELWRWRGLIWALALRDFHVRYRQAAVGVAWALLQPIAFLLVLFPVFSRMTPSGASNAPGWLWLYVGLILWQLFASTVSTSSGSIQVNGDLISKVYFPRLVAPLSSICVNVIDFAFNYTVLLAVTAYAVGFRWQWLVGFVFIIWMLLLAGFLGAGLSALNATYRDVSSMLPVIIQLLFFGSGIFFDVRDVSERSSVILAFNPISTVIVGMRWALLGDRPPSVSMLVASGLATVVAAVCGLWYFRQIERNLSDII